MLYNAHQPVFQPDQRVRKLLAVVDDGGDGFGAVALFAKLLLRHPVPHHLLLAGHHLLLHQRDASDEVPLGSV